MGSTSYSFESRALRSDTLNYAKVATDTVAFNTVFEQQSKRMAHDSLKPNAKVRECRNSEAHPNVLPLLFFLDVTGSMSDIPKYLVASELPKLMKTLIEIGIDVSICFAAVGDHECDRYPLQVSEFESGDAELDMWLTRLYLEGGGGGNAGESYLLGHFFGAHMTAADAFDAGKKGLLVTVGDEPNLRTLPLRAIKETFGSELGLQETSFTSEELIQKASEKYDVHHINVMHNFRNRTALENKWRGPNSAMNNDFVHDVQGKDTIIDKVVEIVKQHAIKHQIGTNSPSVFNTTTVYEPVSVMEEEDFIKA